MNALTLRELQLRHAQLAERAERLRQEWRTMTAASNKALATGREVQQLQARADDYAALLKLAEGV